MTKPIYNSFDPIYKTPFGAVRRLTQCSFTLRLPTYTPTEQPTLVMFRPGYKERYVQLDFLRVEDGAYNVYACTYTPQDLGLHHYYFSVTQNGNRSDIKRKNASEGAFDGMELFQLTVYDENTQTPDWIKGGVLYQILPDRYAKSTEKDLPPTPIGREVHPKWDEPPEWRPNPLGVVTNSDFFGGNLRGIEENLPALKAMHITCLYLCPIFEAHENHRYNTASYERIDPMLGTEEDFVSLCKTAKAHGIRIILDGVFSHTGADSVYFNKYGRYGEKTGAFRDPDSPYRSWYMFHNYPDSYDSWWGFDTLPNVNENDPTYTEYICGEHGIIRKWLGLGAAGWRLDVADELPDEFLDKIRIAVKSGDSGGENVLYGEVWEDASNKESYGVRRRYLIGDQLDSVMNYPFREVILNYIKYSDARQLVDGVMTILEHYPKPSVDTLMNMLSTHDTERAITRLAGEPVGNHDRTWQAEHKLGDAEYVYGRELLKCAMVLQYFLPGVPCVYYGDEVGLEGYRDPFNRGTYPQDSGDLDLLWWTQRLGEIRRELRVFEQGDFAFLEADGDGCAFIRRDETLGEAVVVLLSKSRKGRRLRLSDGKIPAGEQRLLAGELSEKGWLSTQPFGFAAVAIATAIKD